MSEDQVKRWKSLLREVVDFPKPGVREKEKKGKKQNIQTDVHCFLDSFPRH